MHRPSILVGLLLGLTVAAGLGAARAPQDAAPPGMDPGMAAQMEEMMARGQALATPGEAHALLRYFVGEWTGEFSIMGMPPTPSTQSVAAIMDGRFIRTDYRGEMMGQPMTGLGLIGFDNYKKKFVQTWCDSAGTALHYSEGMLSADGKTISLWGTLDEWMTGEMDKPVRYVYRILDDDTYAFEVHDLGIVPGDTKVIEATFRRAR